MRGAGAMTSEDEVLRAKFPRCEYDPGYKRTALVGDDYHAKAAYRVGTFENDWLLCKACRGLDKFRNQPVIEEIE